MLHVAPLAPWLLVAAFVGSFTVPAPAARPVEAPAATVATPAEGAADAPARAGNDEPKLSAAGRWIVLLRDGASVNGAETRARRIGVSVDQTFRNVVRGYAARLSDSQVASLRADPNV